MRSYVKLSPVSHHRVRPSPQIFDKVREVRIALSNIADSKDCDILFRVSNLVDDDVPLHNQPSDGVVAKPRMDGGQTWKLGQRSSGFKNLSDKSGTCSSATVLVVVPKVE